MNIDVPRDCLDGEGVEFADARQGYTERDPDDVVVRILAQLVLLVELPFGVSCILGVTWHPLQWFMMLMTWVSCSRTKQYLSDTNFRPEVFLHLPAGVVRDVADLVPEGNPTKFHWQSTWFLCSITILVLSMSRWL